jgi:tyrosine-protein kinase
VNEGVEPSALELRAHLRVLWRRKGILALVVLVFLAAAFLTSVLQKPVYEATVKVLLQPSDTQSLLDTSGGTQEDPARRVETQIQVAESEPVRAAVVDRLGPVPKARVSGIGNSDIIVIKARSGERTRASRIALAYATAYTDYRRSQAVDNLRLANQQIQTGIDDLQRQIDGVNAQIARQGESSSSTAGLVAARDQLVSRQTVFKQRLDELQVDTRVQTGGAQLVTRSNIPIVKVQPTPLRYGLLALLAGLVVGGVVAFLRESMDDSIKTHDELARAVPGVPVLGLISTVEDWKDTGRPMVVALREPDSPAAESYRSLRTSLQFIGAQRAPRIIQVTSALAREGKTATVANLGVALARAGQRVIVVDCDLRRARLHDFFGVRNKVGFTSLYLGEAPVGLAVQPVDGIDGLGVVASGPLPPNPSEVLAARRTGEVFASLLEICDLVLVDCPPVLPVADSTALSVWVDATMVVVMAENTTRQTVKRTLEVLLQGSAPVVGTVLNNVEPSGDYAYASSYYRPAEQHRGRRIRRGSDGSPTGVDKKAQRPA